MAPEPIRSSIRPMRRFPKSPPMTAEDCRSDCDSSSDVVDGIEVEEVRMMEMDVVTTSLKNKGLGFDLNFPPLDDLGFVGSENEMRFTALCL